MPRSAARVDDSVASPNATPATATQPISFAATAPVESSLERSDCTTPAIARAIAVFKLGCHEVSTWPCEDVKAVSPAHGHVEAP